ncbi:peptidoglycan editing factor PgeF [Alkaliphilus pronyensis]|uniref:Purine nucleoside phosphorylase n=1 Tax=Alkaliphilus pronyensis TaxID=1482732 RepID=A0A6I0FQH1_9FIRM|nr:peptidoglycan editing factor PgeF [Alkaliphilus pronyensis]KAB3538574.1 peptidoglycan editing factor PgeF [Alkaliphilus pronyensis]
MTYRIIEKNNVKYLSFDAFEKLGFIKHGFSTRVGGVSTETYHSMNLGRKTADDPLNVIENTKRFCEATGININRVVTTDQVHEDSIRIVTDADIKDRFSLISDIKKIDGLITKQAGIPLMSFYADCVPLFFVDTKEKVVGLAHAGWRGTVLKIGKKTIAKMIETYNTKPENVIVIIGPSIGKCCYEVSHEVIERFNINFTDTSNFVVSKDKGKYMLDLWMANRLALKEIGVLNRNIITSNICTGCNLQLFYSHRKEGKYTGRMASIIELV